MLVVHHLNNSRSQRVLWLLEELGVPYEIRHYQRDAEDDAGAAGVAQGASARQVAGDHRRRATLAESGAIVEYIVDRYGEGRLVPKKGTADRLRYTYWLHYAEGSAMSPLLMKLVFDNIAKGRVPFFARPVVNAIVRKVMDGFVGPQLKTHIDHMESELARSPWFAGKEFCAADIQMSFPVEVAKQRVPFNASSRPNLMAFLERIHGRPAYRRALERGGAYSFAA